MLSVLCCSTCVVYYMLKDYACFLLLVFFLLVTHQAAAFIIVHLLLHPLVTPEQFVTPILLKPAGGADTHGCPERYNRQVVASIVEHTGG